MMRLGGRFAFTFLLVGGSPSEGSHRNFIKKIIKNRGFARDVLKILVIFEDFQTL